MAERRSKRARKDTASGVDALLAEQSFLKEPDLQVEAQQVCCESMNQEEEARHIYMKAIICHRKQSCMLYTVLTADRDRDYRYIHT
jgi:hypothetical protein